MVDVDSRSVVSDSSSVNSFATAAESEYDTYIDIDIGHDVEIGSEKRAQTNPSPIPHKETLYSSLDQQPLIRNSTDNDDSATMHRSRAVYDGSSWLQSDQEARFISSLGLSNAEKALLCLDQRSSTSSTSLPATPSDVDADIAENIRDYQNFIAPQLALPLPAAQRSPKALKSCLKPVLNVDTSPARSKTPSPLPSPVQNVDTLPARSRTPSPSPSPLPSHILKPALKLQTDVTISPGLLSPNSAYTSSNTTPSTGGVTMRTAISFQEPPSEELEKLRAGRTSPLKVKPIKPLTYNHERQMMRKRQQILTEMMAKNDSGAAAALLTATNAAIAAAAPSDQKQNLVPVIAIIGGSYAGLACLRQLSRKKLKTPAKFILVEKRNFFLHTTQINKALVHGDANMAVRDFSSSIQAHIVHATVTDIDDSKKTIHLDNGDSIMYDQLILATGIGTSDTDLVGITSKDDAISTIRQMHSRILQATSIGIVGHSYSAIELAGELCIKYGPRKRIHLVIPSRLIPNTDQELSTSIWEYIESLGVIIHISPTCHLDNHRIYTPEPLYTDYTIDTRITTPSFFPSLIKAYPKVYNGGKLACRPALQLDDLNLRHVFAIGDISSFSTTIPASHFAALHTGSLTGRNVALTLAGEWKLGAFYRKDVETMAERPVYNVESCGISVGGGVVLRKIPPRTRSRSLSATFKSGAFKSAFTKANSSGLLAPPAMVSSNSSISSASSGSSTSSISITEAKDIEYKDLAKLII